MAISLGACLNAGLLYYKLRRHDIFRHQPGWAKFLAKVALALLAMGAALWWTRGADALWLEATVWWRIGRLSMLVGLGAAIYFLTLWLLGFRLRDFAKKGS